MPTYCKQNNLQCCAQQVYSPRNLHILVFTKTKRTICGGVAAKKGDFGAILASLSLICDQSVAGRQLSNMFLLGINWKIFRGVTGKTIFAFLRPLLDNIYYI